MANGIESTPATHSGIRIWIYDNSCKEGPLSTTYMELVNSSQSTTYDTRHMFHVKRSTPYVLLTTSQVVGGGRGRGRSV
jgi:hypothetical protein